MHKKIMNKLIISDLHLSPARPQITQALIKLVDRLRKQIGALYILGDLFDYWVGDDYTDTEVKQVKKLLLSLAEDKITTFFIRGNRDFLLAEGFSEETSMRILEDETRIQFNGQPALIMHGDQLCTQDLAHQQFRSLVKTSSWQENFLQKSLEERIHLAESMRSISKANNSRKSKDIMDVDPRAVESIMDKHKVSLLIHGHTHRPAIHKLSVNNKPAQRIVLGDWHELGWYLIEADTDMGKQIKLKQFVID